MRNTSADCGIFFLTVNGTLSQWLAGVRATAVPVSRTGTVGRTLGGPKLLKEWNNCNITSTYSYPRTLNSFNFLIIHIQHNWMVCSVKREGKAVCGNIAPVAAAILLLLLLSTNAGGRLSRHRSSCACSSTSSWATAVISKFNLPQSLGKNPWTPSRVTSSGLARLQR